MYYSYNKKFKHVFFIRITRIISIDTENDMDTDNWEKNWKK